MDIEQLIASGKYAEAAGEARRLGDLARAQQLYERIWDWRAAASVARERGDRPELLRLLLEARDFAEAAVVGEQLHGGAAVEQERGAETYERRRMWGEAAALRERLGQLEKARALYIQAQQPLEAARLDETLGRVREAGIAYEKLLAAEPDSADAPRAHLALGRILAGFGRHDEAARHLQKALVAPVVDNTPTPTMPPPPPPAIDSAAETRARRLLVAELAALGYRDAARAVLDPLRAADPSLPPLDALVALEKRAAASDAGARLGGRYRVARLLGSGGMGRVYLARDEFSGRDVAVKVVAPPVDARSAEGYRRFLREAGVVSALRHPNIVSVVASHEDLGLLAMEYMAGGTLGERLGAPMAPARVRSWALEVLAGLEAAHAHGVIHRDLKPQNIFFAASGEAKLGDFGVAHLVDLGATQTAGFIGTLAYMSPEQITGAHLGFGADVYALGITLFQALTGRLPFGGPDFVGQHLGERPPAPSTVRSELSPWDALVVRALAKVPQERFASLEELRNAIRAVPIELATAATATAGGATAAEPTASVAGERYVITATLDSGLVRATDTRLGREVILETLAADAAHVPWLRAVARWGGVRLQRVLRLEPIGDGLLRVVYEAVAGRTPRPPILTAGEAALLMRALAPLHAAGLAHGNIADAVVLEEHGPALLVAGRRPGVATVDDDRAQLAALIRDS